MLIRHPLLNYSPTFIDLRFLSSPQLIDYYAPHIVTKHQFWPFRSCLRYSLPRILAANGLKGGITFATKVVAIYYRRRSSSLYEAQSLQNLLTSLSQLGGLSLTNCSSGDDAQRKHRRGDSIRWSRRSSKLIDSSSSSLRAASRSFPRLCMLRTVPSTALSLSAIPSPLAPVSRLTLLSLYQNFAETH
jgi:hypothetical protein